jgi:hypothetical protein
VDPTFEADTSNWRLFLHHQTHDGFQLRHAEFEQAHISIISTQLLTFINLRSVLSTHISQRLLHSKLPSRTYDLVIMAPTMIDLPMDAQALRELLPTPTFEPTMINIPIDTEVLQAACTGTTTTIIRESINQGISGWWLVATVVIAVFGMAGISIAMKGGQLRLCKQLRNTPPHKLHEKLEEVYLELLTEDRSELKGYKPKSFKGAIYEDDMVNQQRTIKIIQNLTGDATQAQNQNENQSQSQPRSQSQAQAETSAAQDQETAELNETIGLVKGSGSVSDSDSWSDLSPEERDEKEKRPPSPWKSTN